VIIAWIASIGFRSLENQSSSSLVLQNSKTIGNLFMEENKTWNSIVIDYATARGGDFSIFFKPNTPSRKSALLLCTKLCLYFMLPKSGSE
jgi:diketogulonate reductase-like aldo/keto reductase